MARARWRGAFIAVMAPAIADQARAQADRVDRFIADQMAAFKVPDLQLLAESAI